MSNKLTKKELETVKKWGAKYDQDKPEIDLIPYEVILALGEVLAKGAKKYDRHNWRKGMRWGRVFAAAQRHLWFWWGTGKPDGDTGLSHLSHAIANLAFLLAYEKQRLGEDDRYINVSPNKTSNRKSKTRSIRDK